MDSREHRPRTASIRCGPWERATGRLQGGQQSCDSDETKTRVPLWSANEGKFKEGALIQIQKTSSLESLIQILGRGRLLS